MELNNYLAATLGGALIGIAAVLLLWLTGRIAGVSGIVNSAFSRQWSESGWRIAFIIGLVAAGFIFQLATGTTILDRDDYPQWLTISAGLLVGIGTRLGSGCTSGHGICGVSRLSRRSLSATVVFVAIGMATATIISRILL